MNRYECSGCGMMSCDGRCFTECKADYPDTWDDFAPDPEESRKLNELLEPKDLAA